ncbi:MAG TPA: RyR domain-containing protein, partial [Candidatus Binataceae bacterium]|nr:RyR domain-containing protein [Candidatus Binataceae bacterium]
MGKSSNPEKTVIVAGDVTIDWNIATTRREDGAGAAWHTGASTRTFWQRSGAALLADLIEAVAAELRQNKIGDFAVRSSPWFTDPVLPGDPRLHHAYAMWSLHKYGDKPPLDAERPAWRVERFLGLDRANDDADSTGEWHRVPNEPPAPDIVVLDDAGLGFRNHREWWPSAVTAEGQRPWVVIKMARPIAQGELWNHLHRYHAERLIVVMTVDDLRLTEVQVSRELSWEQTAQDLAWELIHNPRVNALSHCAHVVVSFDTAGAFLLSQPTFGEDQLHPVCRLLFDPKTVEGMWTQNHPGGMVGYTSCLTAAVVRQLMCPGSAPDIKRGVQRGIDAMRALHLEGYGVRGAAAPAAKLAFPISLVANELAKDTLPYAEAVVPDAVRRLTQSATTLREDVDGSFWTILENISSNAISDVAQQIVLEGAEAALKGVPLGRFGKLLTVDRREIESFRSIRNLMAEYCRKSHQSRPLSIAVFGSPGSGKSFGITEVAKSVLPGQIEVRGFNLSQFNEVGALHDALHQVRDTGLSGMLPLVFWDEFDTDKLSWLRHFLAPMQDGSFQQGQLTHPIGRAIFVFAGGIYESMESFGHDLTPEMFRDAKGPDFVSRLKGYVNIMGPNRQKGTADPSYIIRRAILLRTILLRDAPQLFERRNGKDVINIDSGVLHALLQASHYKHGTRSMESVVAMSMLTGKSRFERSCLPAIAQLELHVEADQFQSLVQQIELEGELLERLAAAAHKVHCDGKRRDGWKQGPVRDDLKKIDPLLIDYAALPEMYKESNRETVRTIPDKLAEAGYVMIPARSDSQLVEFPKDDIEKLARFEHERWMADKLASGFTLG